MKWGNSERFLSLRGSFDAYRGILPDNIVARNGDTLEDDWPWFDTVENKDETYDPLFVDAVVSNPPYSQNWDSEDKELDPRFKFGVAPKSKADYALA